ncbi:diguanylate cyclase [Rhodoferax saidenbachensis]|uniref:diguanylate cyclase n=1 Tax=Rhodoferax saidenbachensis TaxID=1484693 RepID=A0ABU1ZQ21_9BURK|nr:diguanylate cyclase [Rhodoferax saidenbachensis]MDR7307647.1 diguanylate cyclase (GGDEF)-like protein [Rhodoferax saidenbachensis]
MPFRNLQRRFCGVLIAFICLGVVVPTFAATAQEPLDLTRVLAAPVSLTAHFEYLEDPGAAWTLTDVMESARAMEFRRPNNPSSAAIGFSYTRSAVWLRLPLANPSNQPLQRVLEINYALLAHIDFYAPDARGVYQLTQTGYARPFANRPLPGRFFLLPVTLPPQSQQVVYLRVETPNSLNIPARMWEPQALQTHQHADYALQALYFGVVLAIAFYNLMLFVVLRDKNYLLYVIFSGSVALALGTFSGLGTEFVWGDIPALTTIGVNVFTAVAAAAMLEFARRILNTAALSKPLDRVLQGLIVVNGISFFALIFWFRTFTPWFIVLSVITPLVLLATGIWSALRGQRSAYFFVAAFAAILLAVVLTHLRNLGLLPTNFLTTDGTQIGSAMEMLLLSFALADRYNGMRRDQLQAQEQTLKAQEELVSTLREAEHVLEAKVEERTAELRILNRKLEALSATDGLTGIANRRHFDTTLAAEWTRAARQGHPLALGLLDVDWFKQYNDHYGHQAGDDCLRKVADTLAATMARTGDLVARYGGEEFVFIAPATSAQEALGMARKMCEALQALALPHALSDVGCVTASVGVASIIPDETSTPQTLIQAADEALYAAKAAGRNRAVLAKG